MKIIDAHIHLDQYNTYEIDEIIQDAEAVIAVSTDLESSKRSLLLADYDEKIQPAFGFHPEQQLSTEQELEQLLAWIKAMSSRTVAIGEVGLPYYLRRKNKLNQPLDQYIEVLELFLKAAKELDKPVILHAVYDDASIVCDLLEKHSIRQAHFHWFKGDEKTLSRMIKNRYFISITPDIMYETEIRHLAEIFPLDLIMAETDGPWPFSGPFKGKMTRPSMIHATLNEIAQIKGKNVECVYEQVYRNTRKFYFKEVLD